MLTLGNIAIHPGFWGILLLAVAAGAGEVIPMVGIAALCHEMGHIAALWLFGTPVQGISFTGFGVEIRADTRYLSYGKDIICTLAGPGVNLLLAVICSRLSGDYLLAGANLLQGAFNLMPLPGLDGARALHLVLCWAFDPFRADRLCRGIELCSAGVMSVVSLVLVLRNSAGLFLLLASLGILRSAVRTWMGK